MVNPVGPLHPAAPRPVTSEPTAPRPAGEPAPQPPAAEPVAEPAEAAETTLWELLSPEEREIYSRYSGAGSLTYRADGHRGSEPPVSTGRRIDLRG